MVSKRIRKREEVAEYEQSREERIKQNLQRMQSLGILELSRNLKPKPKPKPKTVRPHKPSSASPRRSSRIKILPTASYREKRPFRKGNKCHQCSQKTTGPCTKCCKCSNGQGQLCGVCLLRRDICNCFSCRRVKGWELNRNPYQTAMSLGFKSVAHYLTHIHGPHGKQEHTDDLTTDKQGENADGDQHGKGDRRRR